MSLFDVRDDPNFDPKVCVNCGGVIGCEFCPGGWTAPRPLVISPLPPVLTPLRFRDPGDENDHPDAA